MVAMAWPLILANSSVPLLGLVDTAVIGQLPGPHHLGAVALGATAFGTLGWVFGFLRMGTTGLAAQAHGAQDNTALLAHLVRAVFLALVIGITVNTLRRPLIELCLLVFAPGAEVAHDFVTYLSIRLLGLPAYLITLACLGWLLGCQRTRDQVLVLVTVNLFNAALDALLVLRFDLAVAGVAYGTVASEIAGCVLALYLIGRELRRSTGATLPALPARGAFFASDPWQRLIALHRDIFLRTLCLQLSFVGFAALGARQGEVTLAANAILLNFLLLASYALDGFAFAAEAKVGSALGARDPGRFQRVVRAGLHGSLVVALLLSLLYALGLPSLLPLLTVNSAVVHDALTHLPWLLALPPLAAMAFLFDGVFIGATRARDLRNGMIVACAGFFLTAWLAVPILGNHGLWLAMTVFMLSRSLWLALLYQRGDAGFLRSSAAA